MKKYLKFLSKKSVFFITPDVKRGLGFEDLLPDYHIICIYSDPLISVLRKNKANILCLEELTSGNINPVKNSGQLLENKLVENYIRKNSVSVPFIAFFKPSLKIEYIIKKKNYKSLGNSVYLNEKFENKIHLIDLLRKDFSGLINDSLTEKLTGLKFSDCAKKFNLPFVIQFGHGWAGRTTFLIENEKSFNGLKSKYPLTIVKAARLIVGYTILNNCCVYGNNIFVGPPALQINGIKKLSPKDFVTCGRQWPDTILSKKMISDIKETSIGIGQLMSLEGYRGFFGIDFLVDQKSGRIYLSEINARLTASSAFYTGLERDLGEIPLLALHYASLLNENLSFPLNINLRIKGAQVIFRDAKTIDDINIKKSGTYKIKGTKAEYVNDDYRPGNLTGKSFIFHSEEKIRDDAEIARLETIEKVLDAPGKLSAWFDRFLT